MARGNRLSHSEHPVQIFQDLSGVTLKHRRELRPLLDALRAKEMTYKWKFPFCLSATCQGRNAMLRVPEDLPRFCETMGIPPIAMPDWYAAFRQSVIRRPKSREETMETQAFRHRRRRSPSGSRNQSPKSLKGLLNVRTDGCLTLLVLVLVSDQAAVLLWFLYMLVAPVHGLSHVIAPSQFKETVFFYDTAWPVSPWKPGVSASFLSLHTQI